MKSGSSTISHRHLKKKPVPPSSRRWWEVYPLAGYFDDETNGFSRSRRGNDQVKTLASGAPTVAPSDETSSSTVTTSPAKSPTKKGQVRFSIPKYPLAGGTNENTTSVVTSKLKDRKVNSPRPTSPRKGERASPPIDQGEAVDYHRLAQDLEAKYQKISTGTGIFGEIRIITESARLTLNEHKITLLRSVWGINTEQVESYDPRDLFVGPPLQEWRTKFQLMLETNFLAAIEMRRDELPTKPQSFQGIWNVLYEEKRVEELRIISTNIAQLEGWLRAYDMSVHSVMDVMKASALISEQCSWCQKEGCDHLNEMGQLIAAGEAFKKTVALAQSCAKSLEDTWEFKWCERCPILTGLKPKYHAAIKKMFRDWDLEMLDF